MEIKNRIKEYRARHDLTQKDLAEKVGVTRQTIVSLEKGTYVPSLLLAMNIAEVFNESIEAIFQKEGEAK
ncbi:helix-turn-helix transcriptional regulator [Chungangia koreensis]|uniref:Helix-turn-helix transcriptional regulator n=1 Tax=Chungangia koreensis TaxID=752657 RepID=A0ABV8X2Q0_9LACT